MSLLLDHLWQSTAVLAVIGLLTMLFRSNGARVRHALWTGASTKFLLPFAGLLALGRYASRLLPSRPAAPPVLETLHNAVQPFSRETSFGSPAAVPSQSHLLIAVVALIWAVGVVAVCGIWLVRWRKLRSILRAARASDIAAPTTVMLSSTLLEPGLIGIVRPVLVLPEGIATVLSAAELQSVLAHEACHLRRRDNLTAALHMVVEALFWFWPPVWWLGARLIAERERACDEAVVAAGSDPQVYAESILKVCKLSISSPLACAAGVSGADLKQRVEEIMRNTVIARLNIPKKALLAFCAAAAVALPLALGLLKFPVAVAQTSTPHPGTEAALRRQIEGWENRQPVTADMDPGLIRATEEQRAAIQKHFDDFGALESITFFGNDSGNDVFRVEFEHASTVWTIGPLEHGKVSTIFFAPAVKRDDNAPSPGLADALRRELEGSLAGKPAYEIMSPDLQEATREQWSIISADAKELGAVRTIAFQNINAEGWDVYHVTFANGTATIKAEPLKDGKLEGLLHTDIQMTSQAQHPGTEASLRRYIESLERGQPNYEEMSPAMADVVRRQLPGILATIKPWGALKSISFKGGSPDGADVYDVTFEHGTAEWSIAPLDADGKVVRRGFRPTSSVNEANILPVHSEIVPGQSQHPGTEASLRRYLESLERGQPNYEEMPQPLADVVRRQLPEILAMIHRWGSLQSIVFKGVSPNGMDVYDVTFEHGTAEWQIAPLDADGKVVRRLFHQTS